MDLVSSLKNTFERTFHAANFACASRNPTLGQVKQILANAEQVTGRAKTASNLASVAVRLGEAQEKLGKLVTDLHSDVRYADDFVAKGDAACEIAEANIILSNWEKSKKDSRDAAKAAAAFDELFGGIAVYMAELPFANIYVNIFYEIAKEKFFEHYVSYDDPANRAGPQGDALRAIDTQMRREDELRQ
jgi:hypothetical protein